MKRAGIIIPEIVIYNTIEHIFDRIREEAKITSESETFLHRLFAQVEFTEGLKFETYDWYKQAVNVLVKDSNQQRKIAWNLGYNLERSNMPTIHILLPGENYAPSGIGNGRGYQDDYANSSDGSYNASFTAMFSSTYNIMITSDNTFEVILIYHFLKAAFISITEHFDLIGLRDPKFSGQDVTFASEMVPPNIYHRNLNISFQYEVTVPSWFKEKGASVLEFIKCPACMIPEQPDAQ